MNTATLLDREPATSIAVEADGGIYLLVVANRTLHITRQTGDGHALIVTAAVAGRQATIVFDLERFQLAEQADILQDIQQVCAVAATVQVPAAQRVVCEEIARQAEVLSSTAHR